MQKKIILLGYMGSGKTIIASKLSNVLRKTHFDLDVLIENEQNLSISSIFKTKGELYFRKLEHEVFKKIIHSNDEFILSLGGGTPCYANNHLFLQNEDVISIYLKTSIEELYRRLSKNKSGRPIIAEMSEEELKEFIAKHLFDRSFYYHQAKHIISTDGKSIEEVVEEIKKLVA
ncbi:shikimate kinase [Flavobacterium lacus]|uniref:Shikimate kinase n=1 Tax=Flavobacterium lacus TaxID=1353778 RepID=A0A328WLQ3_9FLAO|nr:shikimate kinase [Flavobacterium lacus]RAR47103.1 shikimate kinase [Flavobacterium lacus]